MRFPNEPAAELQSKIDRGNVMVGPTGGRTQLAQYTLMLATRMDRPWHAGSTARHNGLGRLIERHRDPGQPTLRTPSMPGFLLGGD